MNKADNGFGKHPENINTNGAPRKDNSWRAIYEEAYNEIVEETADEKALEMAKIIKGEKKTWKEAVARVVRRNSLTGDIGATNNAQNRMEGQPKQTIHTTLEIPKANYIINGKIEIEEKK